MSSDSVVQYQPKENHMKPMKLMAVIVGSILVAAVVIVGAYFAFHLSMRNEGQKLLKDAQERREKSDLEWEQKMERLEN